jgi:hypothetical protein
MTASIPLGDLGAVDHYRRDRWGRYLWVPRNGGKPTGHTRVTTVAKALDDGGGLAPWKSTLSICGLIMRRGLRSQWETLMAETNGDPWYAGAESKARCKKLVEECAAAGGANERRDTGTSLHALTALADAGRTPSHVTEETEADLRAYREGLAAAGVTIMPEWIETPVVLDDHRVAGVFDRLVMVSDFPRPMIADLKCGADLSYSWTQIAVQLGAYANASAVYRQGAANDGSEDLREPMPEVDRDNGLIMWLNAGSGRLELFLVDLQAGWEAFSHSMWARGWRNAQVARPLAEGGWTRRPLEEELAASIEALTGHESPPESPQSAPEPPAAPTAPPAQESPTPVAVIDGYHVWDHETPGNYGTRLRTWLQDRIDVIGKNPTARADLGRGWPAETPTLRSSTDHSPEQLAAIEVVLNAVERQHKIVFPYPRPEAEGDPVGRLLHLFPNTTIEESPA